MLERSDLYDPGLVAALTRREIPGPPSPYPHRGAHRSPRRGASLEFSEHAEYTPGEDLRHLDWKVLAKSDRYFVKRYEDERLQRAVFLVDASASMSYGANGSGGGRGSKYQLAARVAVALAACLLHQGDAVGLALAGGAEPVYLPPRSAESQLEAMMELLGGAEPRGGPALAATCGVLAERLGRGASVFALSDFLDEGDEDLTAFRRLRARGLSPRTVQVLHADELDLPFENTTRFLDLEGPGSLVLDPVAVRRAYAEEIGAFTAGLAAAAEALGIPHALLSSGADPAPPLGRMLLRLGRR